MNEPEGALIIASDSNPCWDTTRLSGTGPPWKGSLLYMKDLQRFVAKQIKAIHSIDPTALVTVGSHSPYLREQEGSFCAGPGQNGAKQRVSHGKTIIRILACLHLETPWTSSRSIPMITKVRSHAITCTDQRDSAPSQSSKDALWIILSAFQPFMA